MLPQKLPLDLMQTKWASEINPVLANPLNNMSVLSGIALKDGVTTINHLLGHTMQGWTILDIDGAATIYRSAPLNNLNLQLTSNAAVIVTLGVY